MPRRPPRRRQGDRPAQMLDTYPNTKDASIYVRKWVETEVMTRGEAKGERRVCVPYGGGMGTDR